MDNYAILQNSEDGNYMFLEATAQIFKNNVLTGEITKLLRFDLTDLNSGPQAKTIYEGYTLHGCKACTLVAQVNMRVSIFKAM